ncbi:MAG: helix-turn-helix domain-containing protein [Acholeplasmatales bacterium]|jgi:transcriptional regulator with XRE-family HTH domain|nr:helix-turn-helix domain-containing protein [Acholeplasmatales bacterium]
MNLEADNKREIKSIADIDYQKIENTDLNYNDFGPHGSYLNYQRRKHRLTLKETEKSGFTLSFLSKIENNKTKTSSENINKILNVMGENSVKLSNTLSTDLEHFMADYVLDAKINSLLEKLESKVDHHSNLLKLLAYSLKNIGIDENIINETNNYASNFNRLERNILYLAIAIYHFFRECFRESLNLLNLIEKTSFFFDLYVDFLKLIANLRLLNQEYYQSNYNLIYTTVKNYNIERIKYLIEYENLRYLIFIRKLPNSFEYIERMNILDSDKNNLKAIYLILENIDLMKAHHLVSQDRNKENLLIKEYLNIILYTPRDAYLKFDPKNLSIKAIFNEYLDVYKSKVDILKFTKKILSIRIIPDNYFLLTFIRNNLIKSLENLKIYKSTLEVFKRIEKVENNFYFSQIFN